MFIRNTLLSSAFIMLVALPAQAQISADELWKSWEALGADMGYTLTSGNLSKSGNRLVAKDVTLVTKADDVATTSKIAEVVLEEAGGAVNITTSDTWTMEATAKIDDQVQPPSLTTINQSGYLLTVAGSIEAPNYAFKADSISFAQTMEMKDEKGTGRIHTSGTFTTPTGTMSHGKGTETMPISYSFAADALKLSMKGESEGQSSGSGNVMIDIAKLSSEFSAQVPVKVSETDELIELYSAGLRGKGNSSTGEINYTISVKSPDMPFDGEGGFASTSSAFELVDAKATLDLTLNGIRVGKLPGVSSLSFNALGNLLPTAKSDEDLLKSGSLTITLTENEAFFKVLEETGLIPADQMAMLPMMMMMFAKPGPQPNSLVTTLELTEQGEFLVNGQSM